ncbi:MAG: class I SAM-dependent methyltransferase [Myxococcales bacterium]|nr:class I SAM-dependent methyltransferase [Myxococcales bacterium]
MSRARSLSKGLRRGTRDHYIDAALYDFEYRRRRDDVRFYRALAQKTGGPVLELGCGTGRIALPLARDGIDVLGVDLSEPMLAHARERLARMRPKAARPRVRLVRADMHALPIVGRFKLVIAAFNTLMHVYRSADLVALLSSLRERLAPGGQLAFDVLNPDIEWLARDDSRRWARTRFTHPKSGEKLIYSTNHHYDPVTQVALINIYYEPASKTGAGDGAGRTRVVKLAHRQYFPEELLNLVQQAGLELVTRYGDFDNKALSAFSESQVLVCRAAR